MLFLSRRAPCVIHTPHKGKEPHRLVKLFFYSKTSDAILRYAFRRYFLTVSGDRFISNATCTQERPRTSHSTRHAISSGGSSKDRMYATARRGAIEDNFARIARCCLSMLCAGACRALTRGEACLPPVFPFVILEFFRGMRKHIPPMPSALRGRRSYPHPAHSRKH